MQKIFFLLLAGTLFSCSDKNPEQEEPTFPIESIEFEPIPDKEVIFKVHPSTGMQLLGAGYDAAADYLSFEAIKAPVFDLEALGNADEEYIEYRRLNASEPKYYVGADANRFLQDMAYFVELEETPEEEYQTAPLFAGTLLKHESFKSDYNHSSQYGFADCEQLFTAQQQLLYPIWISEKTKYRYLTSDFTKDVKELSAEAIIGKYGTHVLKNIGVGIRYRGLFRTSVPTATSTAAAEQVVFYAALTKMEQMGISTGTSVGGVEDKVAQSIGGQLILEFFGGDASLLSQHPTKEEFKAWYGSLLNETNYALTRIINQALPIEQLIEDKSKREQVKEAVKNHLATCRLKISATTPLLQAWDGESYRYFTSYTEITSNYEGAICSLYKEQKMKTTPLFLYSNGKEQRLSTRTPDNNADWEVQKEIGYIYTSQQEGALPLYEATNGRAYYYSTKDKETYGKKGLWEKTGVVGYVMPL